MILRIFLLFSFIITCLNAFSSNNSDSLQKTRYALSFELGHSSTTFLERPDFTRNLGWLNITHGNMTFLYRNMIGLGFKYNDYNYGYISLDQDIGDVWYREHSMFDLNIKFNVVSSSDFIKIMPYFNIGKRKGVSSYVLEYYNSNPVWVERYSFGYEHSSYGYGIGLHTQGILFNYLIVGLDFGYNRYTDKQSDFKGTYNPDFDEDFKVNNEVFFASYSIGLNLDFFKTKHGKFGWSKDL